MCRSACRAGDVVTRDELRQKLWPSDTFVDFDHSPNTAVNKLRETLGDSASSPRYIETLARRGYRFIPATTFERDPPGLHPELEVPIPRLFCCKELAGEGAHPTIDQNLNSTCCLS